MIFLINEEEKIIVHMILIYITNYLALGRDYATRESRTHMQLKKKLRNLIRRTINNISNESRWKLWMFQDISVR